MSLKNSKPVILALLSLPILAGCSTAIEGATQPITFKTIGAENASCDVQTGLNDYKYNVRPPQTIWVQKSRKDMFIVCHASGNRTQNLVVPSKVAGTTFLNSATAGTTATWDATSGAMFKYPDEIVIDFGGQMARPTPLPSYENRDALDPRAQGIEYMGPDTPMLPNDADDEMRYQRAYDDAAQIAAEEAAMKAERQRRIDGLEGGFYGDKTGNYAPVMSAPKKVQRGVDEPIDVTPERSSTKSVVIAPLSEAMPKPDVQPSMLDLSPQTSNHHLGQPIFPSSNSF